MRDIELLAPAANAEVARQAILHGADAVYIGASSHGARKAAANSVADIHGLVEFAHRFRVRVYVTVNTIVYEHELKDVEKLCRDLYESGVDALIVQDMALLRLDLPPIALHASTQCDTRTVAKARFLEDAGFSQIVLAREFTLEEIRRICDAVTVPVECFIHGALCVSYSGRCHASQACFGRSANRGECAQVCRLPFTLKDADGKILSKDRHLLSLRDLNQIDRMEELMDAGVTSFKIEGRLKEAAYVKNTVAAYRKKIDDIISLYPEKYRRTSFGKSKIRFTPVLDKSFNRGFTHYFLDDRRQRDISSPLTPKALGEPLRNVSQLHNGDGISWFDRSGVYRGVNVNRIEGDRIITARPVSLPPVNRLRRTNDVEWNRLLDGDTATRKVALDIVVEENRVSGRDERGVEASVEFDAGDEIARKPMDFKSQFARLGDTVYELRHFDCRLPEDRFVPNSRLADARRRLIEALDRTNDAVYHFDSRRKENPEAVYPDKYLDYRDNVSNSLAEEFYRSHGVEKVERAFETESFDRRKRHASEPRVVMTTRHCILRETGRCLKEKKGKDFRLPLSIESGDNRFKLRFNCDRCEMEVIR